MVKFQDTEGLVLKQLETPKEIQDMENFLDTEKFQGLEDQHHT